ncbi:MAG TPA: DUF2752 domain-containing protein [Acidimicrobiia bacterium]|nr:DUF2752 domain-containing protein [Acidimicrobiia bacterium]
MTAVVFARFPGANHTQRRPAHRHRSIGIATTVSLAAGCAYVGLVDPRHGVYPLCPFHAVTGLWCPGCGSTRALHAILHGHLTTALHDNAVFVLAVPALLALYFRWLARGPDVHPLRIRPWMISSSLVFLAVFGVLRNLPALRVLAP